jgi:hypothetical protein
MCDYSLHLVASRPAKVGEKLVSTSFSSSVTRGFASVEDRNVAVCLLPGTELAFRVPSQIMDIDERSAAMSWPYGADGKVMRQIRVAGDLVSRGD